MEVREIMTEDVTTVEPDEPIRVVRKLFDRMHFHHLLVVDYEELQGVISDRDLLKALSPYIDTNSEKTRDSLTLQKKVHQIMTRDPITVDADTPIREAASMMIDHEISCLPVLERSKVNGIVTWKDIIVGMYNLKTSP